MGAATTHYLYDLSGRLIAEADGATGATSAEYIAFEGMLLAHVATGGVYFIHVDHLGSPQMLTDDTGAVVWDANYRPFGEATVTGTVAFNLRLPGQYLDAESGLHYNYFRDYDAALGRYLESDPIGLSGGWNTYAYVFSNPVLYSDPSGLDALCRAKAICVGAVLGADIGIQTGCAVGAGTGATVGAIGGGGGMVVGGAGDCGIGGVIGGVSGAIVGGMAGDEAANLICEDGSKDCSKATPWQLAQAGIIDPHEYKTEYGAIPNSAFDICACKDGSIVIKAVGMCGYSGGPEIPTYETWK